MISLLAGYTLFNLAFFNYLYPVIYNNNPLSKTLEKIKNYDHVGAYKIFHPSFTYYLPARVKVFEHVDSLNEYLLNTEALILTRQALLEEISSVKLDTVAIHHDLFESSTTALMTNKKSHSKKSGLQKF
jgi:hypothetical protein